MRLRSKIYLNSKFLDNLYGDVYYYYYESVTFSNSYFCVTVSVIPNSKVASSCGSRVQMDFTLSC